MMEGCLEMLGWCDFDFGTCYCYDSFASVSFCQCMDISMCR